VLAGLMQHGIDAYVVVSDLISHETFDHTNNQILYKCIEHIVTNDQSVDIASILSAAEHFGFSESINTKQELKYIKSLMDFPVNQDNILPFAAQIKKFEFARKIQKLTDKIHKDIDDIDGTESINEILQILENPVTDFLREDDGGDLP
jgi:replicative DNA helicase